MNMEDLLHYHQDNQDDGDDNDEDDDDDDEDEKIKDDVEKSDYCTFVVTGAKEAFQSIYVCHTCSNGSHDGATTACICAGCANVCHVDHDVIYIGMGPAYCDCSKLSSLDGCCCCQLEEDSRQEAKRLGIFTPGSMLQQRQFIPKPNQRHNHYHNDKNNNKDQEEDDGDDYVMDVFHIPELEQPMVYQRLIRQAQELVQRTRDTHWVDECDPNNDGWCELEQLAWKIFLRHVDHYQLLFGNNNNQSGGDGRIMGGAEWWVQVKKNSYADSNPTKQVPAAKGEEEPTTDQYSNNNNNNNKSEEAIDLHYDKDEALAESFGIGSFPTLSTATYICGNQTAAPTVIVPHRYDQSETETMNYMMVSHPRIGKHVVFDGRLLHGAPAHTSLRKQSITTTTATTIPSNGDQAAPFFNNDEVEEGGLRLTFLVNIWLTGKPFGVKRLPDEIRSTLRGQTEGDGATLIDKLEFFDEPIETIHLDSRLVEPLDRIELPFVSKGATWIGDDDDDDDGLHLITFPPPPSHESDTVLIHFGPGLQAYLERKGGEDDDAEDVCNVGEARDYQDCYV